MEFSYESLEELRQITEEEYGQRLNDDELAEMANMLMQIIKTIYRPMTLNDGDETRHRQKNTR